MTLRRLALSILILLVFATVGVHMRATHRERAAEAAYPPEGEFVEVGAHSVHAVVLGNGPDLVLIHGSSGNTRDFTHALAEKLAARYRVIALDRPGLGWTDRLPKGAEGIREQAALLRAAAAELGADRPIVLGQSYGAAVALAWAVDAPDSLSALVNVAGPSHPWPGPLPRLYQVTSNPLGSFFAVPLITAFVGDGRVRDAIEEVFLPQAMPAGYADHIGAGLSLRRTALRANAQHRASLKSEMIALSQRYGALTVPIEIVHGDADTTVSITLHAEAMLNDTPLARLTRLPGIGHMPHHVAQDAVIAAVDRAAARAGAD